MKQFIKAFRKNLNLYPTTPDNFTAITLGSYGVMTARGFDKHGDIPVEFDTKRTEAKSQRAFKFNEGTSVEIGAQVGATVGQVAGTELHIKFEKDRSCSLSANICAHEEIRNPQMTLDRNVEKIRRMVDWDNDYVIVTSLTKSRNLLWSTSENKGREVVVDCNVEGLKTFGELANLDAVKFTVRKEASGTMTCATEGDGEEVLGFKLMQLKRKAPAGITPAEARPRPIPVASAGNRIGKPAQPQLRKTAKTPEYAFRAFTKLNLTE